MPCIDAQVLVCCWIQLYPLEKIIEWWLGHSSFFLIIGAQLHWLAFWMVASRKLSCPVLCSGPVPPKETVPPRMKKILLPFPVSWVSSVLQFFLLPLAAFHSFARPPSFHLAPLLSIIFIFVAIVIAWHFLAVPATSLASGHLGLEIKILYYLTLYSAVQ